MLGDTCCCKSMTKDIKHIGKNVELPLVGKVPIISDDYVDPEFGTGC